MARSKTKRPSPEQRLKDAWSLAASELIREIMLARNDNLAEEAEILRKSSTNRSLNNSDVIGGANIIYDVANGGRMACGKVVDPKYVVIVLDEICKQYGLEPKNPRQAPTDEYARILNLKKQYQELGQ